MDYVVGNTYRYSQIPQISTEEVQVNDYGSENIGQNAIHLRYLDGEKDVWFIWDGMANEALLKCVYNS